MSSRTPHLTGARVLVVEDEYLIADDLARALTEEGAVVVGPAPSVAEASRLLEAGGIDAAVLDINLDGEFAFPVADRLTEAGIPFLVASGYGEAELARQMQPDAHVEKPCSTQRLTLLVEDMLQRTASER